MKRIIALCIILAAGGLVYAGQAKAFAISGQRAELNNPRPPESHKGQWYTTPDGCSYSRAQAPGYGVTWHLIINPHHIGQPNARPSCPPML